MPHSLLTRGTEQRLVISNGQIARKIKLADVANWNHLRIGTRLNVNIRGSYYNPPPIFIGLCNGTTNKYFSTATNHAIGIITNDYTTLWDSLYSTSNNRLYIPTSEIKGVKKQDSVLTKFNNTNNNGQFTIYGTHLSNDVEITYSAGVLVDFIKTGSDITCNFYYEVDRSVSETMFNLLMNNPIVPYNYLRFKGTTIITNVNEAVYGNFDAVNIGWISGDYNLEVNSLAYAVYS